MTLERGAKFAWQTYEASRVSMFIGQAKDVEEEEGQQQKEGMEPSKTATITN